MKKNLLWMLAAIFVCGLTAVTLSACSSDDDKNDKADATVEKEIMYARLRHLPAEGYNRCGLQGNPCKRE